MVAALGDDEHLWLVATSKTCVERGRSPYSSSVPTATNSGTSLAAPHGPAMPSGISLDSDR